MTDDDLRFGDVSGESSNNDNIVDSLITVAQVLLVVYVILKMLEILFNIPIPLI